MPDVVARFHDRPSTGDITSLRQLLNSSGRIRSAATKQRHRACERAVRLHESLACTQILQIFAGASEALGVLAR